MGRRKVSFNESSSKSYECPYSLAEIDSTAVWYCGNQMVEAAKAERQWAKRAYKENPSIGLDLVRGLEDFLSSKIYREVQEKTQQCISLVLKEQENQRKEGQNDPGRIRRKSRKVSKHCAESALSLAKYDEKAARRIYKEDAKKRQRQMSVKLVPPCKQQEVTPLSPVSVAERL